MGKIAKDQGFLDLSGRLDSDIRPKQPGREGGRPRDVPELAPRIFGGFLSHGLQSSSISILGIFQQKPKHFGYHSVDGNSHLISLVLHLDRGPGPSCGQLESFADFGATNPARAQVDREVTDCG